jgi:hypothetical protein
VISRVARSLHRSLPNFELKARLQARFAGQGHALDDLSADRDLSRGAGQKERVRRAKDTPGPVVI